MLILLTWLLKTFFKKVCFVLNFLSEDELIQIWEEAPI